MKIQKGALKISLVVYYHYAQYDCTFIEKDVKTVLQIVLSSMVRNKESNKRFIGLRWSITNRLLESIFDELFLLNKTQFENLLVKN